MNFQNWSKTKKIIFWFMAISVLAFLILVAFRIPVVAERAKTKKAVEAIHSQKLTMDTVLGKNLPPEPSPDLVNATLEGIDANNNGIRDDVELAIFKKYHNDKKVRAAELQYAMALQMEFKHVFNSETLVAVIQQEGRASSCISDTAPGISKNDSEEYARKILSISDDREKEVNNYVFNTEKRKQWQEDLYKKYMTSYSLLNGKQCDIEQSSL